MVVFIGDEFRGGGGAGRGGNSAFCGGTGLNMVATGQEIVRDKVVQDQGKVREFYFESGKIEIA